MEPHHHIKNAMYSRLLGSIRCIDTPHHSDDSTENVWETVWAVEGKHHQPRRQKSNNSNGNLSREPSEIKIIDETKSLDDLSDISKASRDPKEITVRRTVVCGDALQWLESIGTFP